MMSRFSSEKGELNTTSNGTTPIYLLRADSDVHPVSLRLDSGYDMLHRKLEQEGKIHHTLEERPERLHPRINKNVDADGRLAEINLEPSRANE
jgi:hypothetical protein